MNIDTLTVGNLMTIANLFSHNQTQSDLTGRYCIVRCHDAGVHAGVVKSHSGRECHLTESRRLWHWKAANRSVFLSGVAVHGIDGAQSKIGEPIEVLLTETCEIIPATRDAEQSIRTAKSDAVS